jgi:UDP-N-acetylmuramoyl-tripeptide--D-alanyl-D-alanine ligase
MGDAVLWSGQDVAQATAGKLVAPFAASGISIDSRAVNPGGLFIALQGPSFDGHAFVAAALKAGAAGAIVSRRPDGVAAGAPLVVVADTLHALRDLAAAARRRSAAKVIAVTGSVGKTATKEMLLRAFVRQVRTHGTTGNLNNHIGLPLSVARMPADTEYAVFEIGMNHAGEIEPLSRLARPHVAIVTTVEAVHLENFRDINAIADAKAEIFAGLEHGGVAILNRDNAHFEQLQRRAREHGAARIVGFGAHGTADARLVNLAVHPTCTCVAADVLGQAMTFKIGMAGRHWAFNSLAVLAAVRVLGGDLGLAGLALGDLTPPEGRGKRHFVERDDGSYELVDDSYNASPPSMRAAFATLAAATTGHRGRRIAAVGDMLELGPDAPALHAGLAADIEAAGIDRVFCAGSLMRSLYDALPAAKRGAHAASSGSLLEPLNAFLRPGDVLLVKGSHGSRMYELVNALLDHGGGRPRAAAKR